MCWFRHCVSTTEIAHRLRTSTTYQIQNVCIEKRHSATGAVGQTCAAQSTRVPHSAAFCRSLFETKVSQVEIPSVGRVETRFAIITENRDGRKFTALRYL